MILFLTGQAVTILGAIFITHMSMRTQVARLQALMENMESSINYLRNDHNSLKDKVDGISRNVAMLEGMEIARKAEAIGTGAGR